MPLAELAAGHYERDGQGDNRKWLVNAYAEPNTSDPARPMRLTRTPGSLLYSSGLSTSCRGIWYQEGFSDKVVVADGTALKLFPTDFSAPTTMTGTLSGTDRVQMASSEAESAFLSDGDIYIAASGATTFAAVTDADFATLLSDHGQTGFSSIASIGQRLVFTYGSRLGFTDAGDFDATTTLNYYTAESSPDPLIAAVVLGNTIWLVGTQTIEPWVQTGDNTDPFSPIQVDPIMRGGKCRDSIIQMDNTLIWIGDDNGVYRLDGMTPTRMDARDAWVTRLIASTDAGDIVCSKEEIDGHAFYIINTPTGCVCLDLSNGTFHKRETYGQTTWEWAYRARAGSLYFAGSRLGAKLCKLSRDYKWDDLTSASGTGTAISRKFSAHLPSMTGRRAIENVRLDGITGAGLASGQGSEPVITMEISVDGGNTFGNGRDRSTGKAGEYKKNPFWTRCGRARPGQTVFRFTFSEPIDFGALNVAVNEGL